MLLIALFKNIVRFTLHICYDFKHLEVYEYNNPEYCYEVSILRKKVFLETLSNIFSNLPLYSFSFIPRKYLAIVNCFHTMIVTRYFLDEKSLYVCMFVVSQESRD